MGKGYLCFLIVLSCLVENVDVMMISYVARLDDMEKSGGVWDAMQVVFFSKRGMHGIEEERDG